MDNNSYNGHFDSGPWDDFLPSAGQNNDTEPQLGIFGDSGFDAFWPEEWVPNITEEGFIISAQPKASQSTSSSCTPGSQDFISDPTVPCTNAEEPRADKGKGKARAIEVQSSPTRLGFAEVLNTVPSVAVQIPPTSSAGPVGNSARSNANDQNVSTATGAPMRAPAPSTGNTSTAQGSTHAAQNAKSKAKASTRRREKKGPKYPPMPQLENFLAASKEQTTLLNQSQLDAIFRHVGVSGLIPDGERTTPSATPRTSEELDIIFAIEGPQGTTHTSTSTDIRPPEETETPGLLTELFGDEVSSGEAACSDDQSSSWERDLFGDADPSEAGESSGTSFANTGDTYPTTSDETVRTDPGVSTLPFTLPEETSATYDVTQPTQTAELNTNTSEDTIPEVMDAETLKLLSELSPYALGPEENMQNVLEALQMIFDGKVTAEEPSLASVATPDPVSHFEESISKKRKLDVFEDDNAGSYGAFDLSFDVGGSTVFESPEGGQLPGSAGYLVDTGPSTSTAVPEAVASSQNVQLPEVIDLSKDSPGGTSVDSPGAIGLPAEQPSSGMKERYCDFCEISFIKKTPSAHYKIAACRDNQSKYTFIHGAVPAWYTQPLHGHHGSAHRPSEKGESCNEQCQQRKQIWEDYVNKYPKKKVKTILIDLAEYHAPPAEITIPDSIKNNSELMGSVHATMPKETTPPGPPPKRTRRTVKKEPTTISQPGTPQIPQDLSAWGHPPQQTYHSAHPQGGMNPYGGPQQVQHTSRPQQYGQPGPYGRMYPAGVRPPNQVPQSPVDPSAGPSTHPMPQSAPQYVLSNGAPRRYIAQQQQEVLYTMPDGRIGYFVEVNQPAPAMENPHYYDAQGYPSQEGVMAGASFAAPTPSPAAEYAHQDNTYYAPHEAVNEVQAASSATGDNSGAYIPSVDEAYDYAAAGW